MIQYNPKIAAILVGEELATYYHQCGFTLALTAIPLYELALEVGELEEHATLNETRHEKEVEESADAQTKAEEALDELKHSIQTQIETLGDEWEKADVDAVLDDIYNRVT